VIFDPNEMLPGQTPIDPDEAKGLIPGHIRIIAELNEFEAQNILEAQKKYLAGKRRVFSLDDPEFHKRVHREMFGQVWKWAGKYRQSDKNIGKPWFQIPEEMKKGCEDFRYWTNQSVYPAPELAVRFHHRLVSIHPFPNGNGRYARLIADMILKESGDVFLTWGSGNLFQKTPDRAAYIAGLQDADRGDFHRLLEFAKS
jgi:Fic-DOC domain mobile mystery protein B